jgi:hypothetical protein
MVAFGFLTLELLANKKLLGGVFRKYAGCYKDFWPPGPGDVRPAAERYMDDPR